MALRHTFYCATQRCTLQRIIKNTHAQILQQKSTEKTTRRCQSNSTTTHSDFAPKVKTQRSNMDIEKANPEQLKAIIAEDLKNPVFLYMKGVPAQPRCGFSANVVKILQHIGVPFESRDVLASPALREAIKAYSDWPTLPQLYIAGEFVGGSDIITDLFKRGELQKMLAPMIDKPKTQNHNNS